MQPSGLDGRIPVFVFPQSLTFYVSDQTTHKQILTIYNPYDFRISFNILCNNPTCFEVEPSHGVVFSKCSVDIIVTRTNLSLSDARDRDRVRVVIAEDGARQMLGKKDIPAILQAGVPDPRSGGDSDHFESVRASSLAGAGSDPSLSPAGPNPRQQPFGTYRGNGEGPNPSLLLVSAALLCLAGLLMPTEGDTAPTVIPEYMHLNSNIKIVLAYALGLLTYAIMKPM